MTRQARKPKVDPGITLQFNRFEILLTRKLGLLVQDRDLLHKQVKCACSNCQRNRAEEINGHHFKLATDHIGRKLLFYKRGCELNRAAGDSFLSEDAGDDLIRALTLNTFLQIGVGQPREQTSGSGTRRSLHRQRLARRRQRIASIPR